MLDTFEMNKNRQWKGSANTDRRLQGLRHADRFFPLFFAFFD